MELQQRLVHRPELLGPEVAVVHRPPAPAVLYEGERPDRVQQVVIGDLAEREIANHDLLDAIRALAFVEDGRSRRPVDYRNLGAEELGSVYESLLELHPEIDSEAAFFDLKSASGNERKTTGSYY